MSERARSLAVILDFDGTITMRDIGALLVGEFAHGDGWKRAEERYTRGQISLREVWRIEMHDLYESEHEAMRDRAVELAEIRPGFVELVQHCLAEGIPIEVASSGIRFYIDAVLDMAGVQGLHVAAPDIGFDSDGRGLVTFKNGVLDCDVTAMCKCERIWRQRRAGREVLFVGDGHSDMCSAAQADHVAALGALAEHCEGDGIEFTPFEDFFQVRELVAGLTEGK